MACGGNLRSSKDNFRRVKGGLRMFFFFSPHPENITLDLFSFSRDWLFYLRSRKDACRMSVCVERVVLTITIPRGTASVKSTLQRGCRRKRSHVGVVPHGKTLQFDWLFCQLEISPYLYNEMVVRLCLGKATFFMRGGRAEALILDSLKMGRGGGGSIYDVVFPLGGLSRWVCCSA